MSRAENKHYIVQAGGKLQGSIRVPGDKSISHRAIMLGSLAEGVTSISGLLAGEDVLATLAAFRAMGVQIDNPSNGKVTIYGVGMDGLTAPEKAIYLGNSGTSMRLLTGLLAGQNFPVSLTSDNSLSSRPMQRVVDPLAQMGAVINSHQGKPPLTISAVNSLSGIDYALPIASAQVKSAVLLAGLYAQGTTKVTEPAPTRDHTERMLAGMGYNIAVQGNTVSLQGGSKLVATDIEVPADISSATFFMVGAAITEGSDLLLTHVGINPTRIGAITILRMMGADISLLNERMVGGEPVADIQVKYAPLQGITIPEDQVPLAIDEFPVLFIAAACAQGQTILTGAAELRVKESDRIQAMADGLQILGIDAQATDDGIIINGGVMGSGTVASCDDHRIAMAFAIAALRAEGTIQINDCANVATSFPNFVALASEAGLQIAEYDG